MKTVKDQAIALKKRLNEIEDEKHEIEHKLYELRRLVEPKAEYGNMKVIFDPNYQDWMTKEKYEAIRLVDYLANEHEKDEHMRIFGQISGDWKTQRNSVTYYRNEYGVLNHNGGGYVLLKDGIPCSDEEWEAIKQGNIPNKFSNFKNFR